MTEFIDTSETLSPWYYCMAASGYNKDRHHPDGLHILFKKGGVSDLLAAILVEVAEFEKVMVSRDGSCPEDPNAQLRLLFAQFQHYVRERHISVHKLVSWTMLRLGRKSVKRFPTVTDRYKCGDVKAMLFFIPT